MGNHPSPGGVASLAPRADRRSDWGDRSLVRGIASDAGFS